MSHLHYLVIREMSFVEISHSYRVRITLTSFTSTHSCCNETYEILRLHLQALRHRILAVIRYTSVARHQVLLPALPSPVQCDAEPLPSHATKTSSTTQKQTLTTDIFKHK